MNDASAIRAEVKAAVEEWFTNVSLDDLFAVKGWDASGPGTRAAPGLSDRVAALAARWEKHADYLEGLGHGNAVDHAETLREDYLPELRELIEPAALDAPEPDTRAEVWQEAAELADSVIVSWQGVAGLHPEAQEPHPAAIAAAGARRTLVVLRSRVAEAFSDRIDALPAPAVAEGTDALGFVGPLEVGEWRCPRCGNDPADQSLHADDCSTIGTPAQCDPTASAEGADARLTGRPHSERDGPCICDYNPETTDGPDECCPFHGRPYAYWVERGDELAARLAQRAPRAEEVACGMCSECQRGQSCTAQPDATPDGA